MGRPLDEMQLSVIRRPGSWEGGDWVMHAGDEQTISFIGGRPQPAGPAVLEFLPEGVRNVVRFVMFVHDDQPELLTVDPAGAVAADVMTWRGDEHLLVSGEDWRGLPSGHSVYGLVVYAPDERRPKVTP